MGLPLEMIHGVCMDELSLFSLHPLQIVFQQEPSQKKLIFILFQSFRVLIVYSIGAIAGSLASSVIDPTTNLVGFALMLSRAVVIVYNDFLLLLQLQLVSRTTILLGFLAILIILIYNIDSILCYVQGLWS